LPGSRHIAHSACECILPAARVRTASDLLLSWLGWVGEVHSVRKSVFDPHSGSVVLAGGVCRCVGHGTVSLAWLGVHFLSLCSNDSVGVLSM